MNISVKKNSTWMPPRSMSCLNAGTIPAHRRILYFKSGAGVAYGSGDTDPAAFAGLEIDWENRRFFTLYENRFFYAGDQDKFIKHKARIGVAPYEGDYGDLHTWLMLQADYDAGADDTFSLTPLVRLFKGTTLIEAGYNLDGGVLIQPHAAILGGIHEKTFSHPRSNHNLLIPRPR
jgi:hypothetical protein